MDNILLTAVLQTYTCIGRNITKYPLIFEQHECEYEISVINDTLIWLLMHANIF
jgi:hypothetical protein